MTSSGLTQPFRRTLLRVSEDLTRKNVQDLAFLCEDITPARREQLNNGRDLFAALQGHDLLHERKVDILIGWLDDLKLSQASKPLKDYRQSHLQPYVTPQEKCFIHEDIPIKRYCVSCDTKLCSECAFESHRGAQCHIIELSRIEDEIKSRRAALTEKVDTASENSTLAQKLWEEKKKFLEACREATRENAFSDYLALLENVAKKKRAILETLESKRVSDMKELLNSKRQLESVENDVEDLMKTSQETSDYSLGELQRINKATKKVAEIGGKIEEQKEEAKKKTVGLVYKKVDNDGTFGTMRVSTLVGSVVIENKQIVNLFDDRHVNGGIVLICVDPGDPTKEYWRHPMKVDDITSPLVLSCISLWYDGRGQVILAVGRVVYAVRSHWSGSLYDYVESVTPVEIGDVPGGSWVSSVTAHKPSRDEFLISIHNSKTLREYRITGEALRVIDVSNLVFFSGITCVAYCKDKCAIIGRGCNHVALFDYDGTVKQCGSWRPPSEGLTAILVIWTGSHGLVLFTSDGAGMQWKVVEYNKAGQLVKECVEGTAESDLDVPVTITYWQNTGYVTLSNNTIRSFAF